MSTLKTPFRYDFVGSFLRPQALKDAKAAYQDGEITKEAFDKVVNEEITKVVAKQKELGYPCDHRWRVPQNLLASGFYVGI